MDSYEALKYLSKKNKICTLSEVKEAGGAEVWLVSWDARYGDYSNCTKRVCKAFFTMADADAFKESLVEAHSLLQNTVNINIRVEQQK